MRKKLLIIPKQIITANNNNDILRNFAIEITDGRISRIDLINNFDTGRFDGTVKNYNNLTLIPGFVQTHVHLCQTLFRGMADDLELLDWLKNKIFPYENAHNQTSLRSSAKLGILELQTSGTTTILDMGTIRHQEIIFDELINSNMRAIAGKCMMDVNGLYPSFKESKQESIKQTLELAKTFHNSAEGKIKYGFAPRFVLSCSEGLLKETFEIMKDFEGSLYHTHSSENKNEVEEVRHITGMDNIEYFNSIGVLCNNTVLAHGIHVSDKEIDILKNTGTRIAHCPSANLKLGSGIADIPRYLDESISVSLGADGPPCNNNLSMFNEMKLAALIQKPVHSATTMDACTVFKLATIEGAKALHLDKETGSIETGKKADIVLLDLEKANQPLLDNNESLYSSIVYSASKENVRHVFIEGKQVVENGKSIIYDENEIVAEAKKNLKLLLNRVSY